MVSYRLELTKTAAKELRSLERGWMGKILVALEALAEEPRPSGCKKLVGSEFTYRIRVGDYRVVYELQDSILLVLVVRIRHRRDVYR